MAATGNGEWAAEDKQGRSAPTNEIEMYSGAISPSEEDELLANTNLGLGYYSEKEMWQQVESFRYYQYGKAAFGRRIEGRAREVAKRALAIQKWNDLGEEDREKRDRRRFLAEYGEAIWEALSDERKVEAINRHAGIDDEWTPPHGRMIAMRHEASRSREARTLDNLFGRVKKVVGDGAQKAQGQLQKLRGSM